MKQHIYYSSTAYLNEFSENKNSSFKNNIGIQNLNYIAKEPLEAALVNLSFTLKEKISDRNLQLGVRSSIQLDADIRASNYDRIIYTFIINSSKKTSINYEVPSTQYIYFPTTKEHLSRAKFEIVDLSTNELLSDIDYSSNPTLIEIAARRRKMPSFSMILESGDARSQELFMHNNNMNFTTCLPERLELQGESWAVICKGVQITGSLWNVQDKSFSVKYLQYFSRKDKTPSSINIEREQKIFYVQYFVHRKTGGTEMKSYKRGQIVVSTGSYRDRKDIVNLINTEMKEKKFPAEFSTRDDKTILTSTLSFDADIYSESQSKAEITVTSELSKILGYSDSDTNKQFNLIEPNTPDWTSSFSSPVEDFPQEAEHIDIDTFQEFEFFLPPYSYKTTKAVTDSINDQLNKSGVPVIFTTNVKSTKITSNVSFDTSRYERDSSKATLSLSPNLSNMLGFTSEKQAFEMNMLTTSSVTSEYEEQINAGLPLNLIVQLDLVQTRVVGQRHLPILQSLYVSKSLTRPNILHFAVRENNVALLETKLFSQINVKITDIDGNVIRASNDYPTILHLNFMKLR